MWNTIGSCFQSGGLQELQSTDFYLRGGNGRTQTQQPPIPYFDIKGKNG